MIKQMQKRFIWVSMGAFTAVMLVLFALLNGLNAWQTVTRVQDLAVRFAQEAQGQQPPTPPQMDGQPMETPWNMEVFFGGVGEGEKHRYPYYTVEWDATNQVATIVTNETRDLTNQEALFAAVQFAQTGRTSQWSNASYYVMVDQRIAVVDATQDVAQAVRLLGLTSIIFLLCVVIVYGLLIYFSRRAIQPLLDNIQRQKEFISNASHEIKTPLAVLSTNNDVLEMTGTANEWTQSNRRQIQRLNQLVEQMLLLARFDEGQMHVQREAVDVIPLVQQVMDELTPLLNEQQGAWQVELPDTLVQTVDASLFVQVVRLLMENAVKYHVNDEPIRIHWRDKEQQLVVANTCEPMTEEESQRLFERFYRLDASRNRERGGSGMGLSIAQSLAELNQLTLLAVLTAPTEIEFRLQF